MSDPKIVSVSTSGNTDAGQSLQHTATDSAGNTLSVNIANPSGHVNEATLRCAGGDSTRNLSASDARELLKSAREAAPATLLGVTISEGGASPLASMCGSPHKAAARSK